MDCVRRSYSKGIIFCKTYSKNNSFGCWFVCGQVRIIFFAQIGLLHGHEAKTNEENHEQTKVDEMHCFTHVQSSSHAKICPSVLLLSQDCKPLGCPLNAMFARKTYFC